MEKKKPIQIVRLTDLEAGSQLIYNQKALEECLADIPPEAHVVIMTINGALRTGKSFLMNAIVHYLQHGEIKPETKIGHNFHWKHGIEADTMGMWLWGEPIKITLKNGNSAYLLMIDTQGIFDSNLNPKLTNCLFGLSTLISSVQIYNIEKRIQEDHLQHLELFAEYANAITKITQKHHVTPFQHLKILVRDWPNYTHPIDPIKSAQEAETYLNKIMSGKNPSACATRDNIRRCYKQIDCACLPHPGMTVAEGEFTDDFNSVRPGFIANLNHFIESLLTHLEAKMLFSELMQVREVSPYLSQCLEMLYSCNELPEPGTILETTVNALESGIRYRALDMYQIKMRKRLGSERSLGSQDLKDLHQAVYKTVLEYVDTKLVMGDEERKNQFVLNLEEKINQEYQRFITLNNQKLRWMTYVWVVVCGIAALIFSKLTVVICTAEMCLKISNFSYGVFLLSVLIVITRFMFLMGLFHQLKNKLLKS